MRRGGSPTDLPLPNPCQSHVASAGGTPETPPQVLHYIQGTAPIATGGPSKCVPSLPSAALKSPLTGSLTRDMGGRASRPSSRRFFRSPALPNNLVRVSNGSVDVTRPSSAWKSRRDASPPATCHQRYPVMHHCAYNHTENGGGQRVPLGHLLKNLECLPVMINRRWCYNY